MSATKASIIKIICLGNVSTGKTCIVRRYVHNEFSHQYRTTIGVDFVLKEIDFNGTPMKVQFWDLAGQERFTGLTRPYYRNSGGAVVVFDLTSRDTFDAVQNWKRDVDNKVELPNGQKLPILLLGNKSDLLGKEQQCVSDGEIEQAVKDLGFFKFVKVSAMSGENIHTALTELTHEVARRMAVRNSENQSQAQGNNSIQGSSPQNHSQQQSQQHNQAKKIDVSQPQQEQNDNGGCC
jgi:Ras-related protein Rab-32